jgi:hypothetical protein
MLHTIYLSIPDVSTVHLLYDVKIINSVQSKIILSKMH